MSRKVWFGFHGYRMTRSNQNVNPLIYKINICSKSYSHADIALLRIEYDFVIPFSKINLNKARNVSIKSILVLVDRFI